MFSHCQKIANYLVVVLLVFLSGVCYGQKKKHKQKLTAYDSLFLESSYPENRKLLLGTWKYVQTEGGPNVEEAKRYSADDSSRLYIRHDPRFSIRNFYVVHYVENDSITEVLFSGLSDSVPDVRALQRLEREIKYMHHSHLKYLSTIATNITQKNYVTSFTGDSIQLAKTTQYLLEDSIGKSISYTFTLHEVTVKRDSAGYISEASYPYIAKTGLFDDNSREGLFSVRIGKEEGLQRLDGMIFYVYYINNGFMKISPFYDDTIQVTYKKEF